MLSIVICQYHNNGLTDGPGGTGKPWEWADKARERGWHVVASPLFSPDGRPTWLCPECVKRWSRVIHEKETVRAGRFYVWQPIQNIRDATFASGAPHG